MTLLKLHLEDQLTTLDRMLYKATTDEERQDIATRREWVLRDLRELTNDVSTNNR